jgi:ADP-ribose pyrophosphatase YjhB (NUDIX family)
MFNKPQESKTFINLGVVLNNKGEVLIIRRKVIEKGSDDSVLQWAFPGGKQRYNETRQEAIKRTVLSETGYNIQWIRQIDLAFHSEISVFIAYHLCKLNSSDPIAKPQEPHEIAEIRWIKPEDMKRLITTTLNPKVANELGI